jgi:hypothetical protein
MGGDSAVIQFITDPIDLNVTVNVPVTLQHSTGRPVTGWVILWATAPCVLSVVDPAADTRQSITLVPNNSASLRVALVA